jgi:ADP-heptose:LPS heptosyltransferase
MQVRQDLADGSHVKVLVARIDKLGDVVLSLPVFADLKACRPEWQVHALVAAESVPLVENDPHVEVIWTFSEDELSQLEARLAKEAYDAAILLFYHRPLASLLRRLRIPRRVGPLSKPSSWFLLNRGAWQRRSRAVHHERDYNVKLARKLAGAGGEYPDPRLYPTPGQLEIGARFRHEEAPGAETVVFVHPGSSRSALNWEPARYAEVANNLAQEAGWRVFITGGPADRAAIKAIDGSLDPEVRVLAERYSLRDFIGVLTGGDLLIGPSTGPLHMAAALGLAVVGIYSPVLCQSIARWGPLGRRARALAPAVPCPARLLCFAERCRHYNCMDQVSVAGVVAVARELIAALEERE